MKNQLFLTLLLLSLFFSCDSITNQGKKANDSKQKNDETNAVSMKPSKGIDISKYQGDEVEFLSKHKENLSFIICKATEGTTYTDPDFKQNWHSITEGGFIRGAYHFYRSQDAPSQQVDNFLNNISDLKDTDIAPIVDFENSGIDPSQTIESVQTNLLIFLNLVEKKSGRKPIIYSDLNTGNKYLTDPIFSNYALWIAFYTDANEPQLPAIWNEQAWSFWQKKDDYKIDGDENDFDVFNGNTDALLNFIKSY